MSRLTAEEAAGMTVNERLVLSGLIEAFEQAVAAGNESEVRRILREVFLSDANIDGVVKQTLSR